MTHFHYGSGEHGCLYDNGPFYAKTVQEAVDALAETFSLGRSRKAELKLNHSLEPRPHKDGAEYCDVVECAEDCNEDDYQD